MATVNKKLDVANILLSAIVAPIVHWRRILWFAIPLIVIELATLSTTVAGVSFGVIALSIVTLAARLLLAVASHRIFILGEKSMAGQGFVW